MTRDELALIWFDYNDFNFSKTEKILTKFDQISDIFDKNCVKRVYFFIFFAKQNKAKFQWGKPQFFNGEI